MTLIFTEYDPPADHQPQPLLSVQDMIKTALWCVQQDYRVHADEHDWDMPPVIMMADDTGYSTVFFCDNMHPAELLPDAKRRFLNERGSLHLIGMAFPAWTKDPESGQRNGEIVMVRVESRDGESESWSTPVERCPQPTLVGFEKLDGDSKDRLTNYFNLPDTSDSVH